MARALIEAVADEAATAGAARFYWMTQAHNAVARALYDRVAAHKGFIRYDFPLPPPHVVRVGSTSSIPSLAFWLAALVLALAPGPGIAYVVARTAAGGRAEGMASCAGTALGGMVHVGAAAFGLSALLARSAHAFTAVKYVGAAYLLYLGIRLLLARAPDAPVRASSSAPRRALLEGVVVEALNVKTALFFLAFLPQFLVGGSSVAVQLVVMGTVCVVLNTLVDIAAVFGAERLLGSHAAGRKRAKLLNRASGVTLVGLGLYVAGERNA